MKPETKIVDKYDKLAIWSFMLISFFVLILTIRGETLYRPEGLIETIQAIFLIFMWFYLIIIYPIIRIIEE